MSASSKLLGGLVTVSILASPAVAGQIEPRLVPLTDARTARLEQWLKAVFHHRPGEADAAANMVASWSSPDMRALDHDEFALVQLMRHGDSVGPQFEFPNPPGKPILERYPPDRYRRIEVLACAAGGYVPGGAWRAGEKLPLLCEHVEAAVALDTELKQLAAAVYAGRMKGDHDDYILRRGALLQADVALLPSRPGTPLPVTAAPSLGAAVSLSISDGEGVMHNATAAIHLAFARSLLDQIVPPTEDGVDPKRDAMVRQWYVTTAAWMQQTQQYMTNHLAKARVMFPNDPHILFLSGCERETYATPAMQSAVRSASLPTGVDFEVGSDQSELRAAEGFFRDALVVKKDFPETRLHLGHVLLLRGRAADAVIELQQATTMFTDDQQLYYAELFAGAAFEATGQFDQARMAYARAAELVPAAQSPRLALSALDRKRGDRAAALSALRDVFALPVVDPSGDDPWWLYAMTQARNADALLADLRRPFLEQTP